MFSVHIQIVYCMCTVETYSTNINSANCYLMDRKNPIPTHQVSHIAYDSDKLDRLMGMGFLRDCENRWNVCKSNHNTRAAVALAQCGMDPTSASLASQNWRKCQGSSNFHFSKTWNISKHQLLKCKQLSCFNWHFLFLKQVSVWKCVVANNFLFFSTLNVNWVAASWTLNLSALRKEKSLVCSHEGGYWG